MAIVNNPNATAQIVIDLMLFIITGPPREGDRGGVCTVHFDAATETLASDFLSSRSSSTIIAQKGHWRG
jgi:hypothetical protein